MSTRAGYWIGSVLIAVTLFAAIAFGVAQVLRTIDRVGDWPKSREPAATVEFEKRGYTVYLEWPDSAERAWNLGRMSVRSQSDEREVEVRPASGNITYDFPDHHGVSVARFTIPEAGSYRVTVDELPPGSRLVFGESVVGSIARTIVIALAILAVGIAAGLGLIVATVLKRRRT